MHARNEMRDSPRYEYLERNEEKEDDNEDKVRMMFASLDPSSMIKAQSLHLPDSEEISYM